MGDFFHGWRRKMGCVTLMMAAALIGGWLRSLVVNDGVTVPFDGFVMDVAYVIQSARGELRFIRLELVDAGSKAIIDTEGPALSYWWFVSSLTLLSACLLLWPRKRALKNPIPAKRRGAVCSAPDRNPAIIRLDLKSEI